MLGTKTVKHRDVLKIQVNNEGILGIDDRIRGKRVMILQNRFFGVNAEKKFCNRNAVDPSFFHSMFAPIE